VHLPTAVKYYIIMDVVVFFVCCQSATRRCGGRTRTEYGVLVIGRQRITGESRVYRDYRRKYLCKLISQLLSPPVDPVRGRGRGNHGRTVCLKIIIILKQTAKVDGVSSDREYAVSSLLVRYCSRLKVTI